MKPSLNRPLASATVGLMTNWFVAAVAENVGTMPARSVVPLATELIAPTNGWPSVTTLPLFKRAAPEEITPRRPFCAETANTCPNKHARKIVFRFIIWFLCSRADLRHPAH